jgi:hypothetical protein
MPEKLDFSKDLSWKGEPQNKNLRHGALFLRNMQIKVPGNHPG